MAASVEQITTISERFHRFQDGLILSFEFLYIPNQPLAAHVLLHARDHGVEGDIWKKIRVVVKDVIDLRAQVKGNQFNALCSGVRLLMFGDVWCVDIDGNYAMDADPSSLDDVRREGELYIIGRYLEVDVVAQ